MIQSFFEIIIWTADMPRAVQFWRDTVGLKIVEESAPWSTFAPPAATASSAPILGVMATTDGAPVPHQEPGKNGVQQGAIFSFTVPSLNEAIAAYAAKGVPVHGEVYEQENWGRCAAFLDPDRNVFMLVERHAAS